MIFLNLGCKTAELTPSSLKDFTNGFLLFLLPLLPFVLYFLMLILICFLNSGLFFDLLEVPGPLEPVEKPAVHDFH